jgi:hypothetical protein
VNIIIIPGKQVFVTCQLDAQVALFAQSGESSSPVHDDYLAMFKGQLLIGMIVENDQLFWSVPSLSQETLDSLLQQSGAAICQTQT